jgi:hypothetical protein
LIDPVLLVALSNAVAKMPVVVDAPSIDAAVVSLTVTAVLLLIKSIETLEFVVSNDGLETDDVRSKRKKSSS